MPLPQNLESMDKQSAKVLIDELINKEQTTPQFPVDKPIRIEHTERKAPANTSAMFVSYAKDIFCSALNNKKELEDMSPRELMDVAIGLVKQAKEAFE